jgi:hypothetical protein
MIPAAFFVAALGEKEKAARGVLAAFDHPA